MVTMKYSRKREAILQVVRATDIHPRADWIYAQVLKTVPNISLATVYRNLSQLVESEQLTAVRDGNQVRYDRNLERHDHFNCHRCGTLYDIEVERQGVIGSVETTYDFQVADVRIEVTGTCRACHQQTEKGK